MLLDGQNLFSDAQAVTAAAASTNYINLSVARDIGIGEDLYVFLTVDVAMTDSGSDSVMDVYLRYDTTTTFTPDAQQRIFTVPAVSAIGFKIFGKISPMVSTRYQYVQLYYDPIGSNLTAGTFTSGIVMGIDKNVPYAKGYTIS
jgi:hypothetical protein